MTPLLLPARCGLSKVDNVYHADALTYLRALPDGYVDAVITDPPYAEIDREYGRLTEAAWMSLMMAVVIELRRVLKPSGSATIILQPNFECVGRMRLWLWKFLIWCGEYWNVVQDAYWWNISALPAAGVEYGFMRSSIKTVVWIGEPHCYKNQLDVLWKPSQSMLAVSAEDRALKYHPSGAHLRASRIAETVQQRGGTTPFNLLPIANTNSSNSAGSNSHGAGTPEALIEWWVRYISKPNDIVLDPFMGSGTTALTARKLGRHYLGCDLSAEYVSVARQRLAQPYTLPFPQLLEAI